MIFINIMIIIPVQVIIIIRECKKDKKKRAQVNPIELIGRARTMNHEEEKVALPNYAWATIAGAQEDEKLEEYVEQGLVSQPLENQANEKFVRKSNRWLI